MLQKFSISHKGLLLISIPLIFELVFVFILTSLQEQAEITAQEEWRCRKVLSNVGDVVTLIYDSGASLFLYSLTRSDLFKAAYENKVKKVPIQVNTVKNLLSANNNKKQMQYFYEMQKEVTNATGWMQELETLISTNDQRNLAKQTELFRQNLRQSAVIIRDKVVQISDIENAKNSTLPAQQAAARERVKSCLYIGIGINVLISILLTIFFFKNIVKRIEQVVDNTVLLSQNKPLNPELSGTDEITQMDKSFHEMAKILIEAKKKTAEIDEMKRDFVNMVSHDLRTPLTGVKGFLDLLERGAYGQISEKGLKLALRQNTNINRLVHLVNGILDIEKMEAGKMEMDYALVSIKTILENAVEMVMSFAEQQSVNLEIKLNGDKLIHADRDRLLQVIQNLLSNAIKASPKNQTVTLYSAITNSELEIKIIDHGMGISDEAKDKIFNRFYQDGKGSKSGSGLGLAICKSIVELHNGTIGVDSEKGGGSIFWIKMPTNVKVSLDHQILAS